jgi:hypothetical protein
VATNHFGYHDCMSSSTTNYARLLPGVPHVESPFFSRIVEQLALDDATRRIAFDLYLKGYAVIDFPDPEIDLLAETIKRELHDQYDWDMWRQHGHQAGVSLRSWDAWKQLQSVRRIASNPGIIDLLSTLYGRRAWPFQTLNFPVGTQQHFHTDAVHFNSSPERFMCGVWVALEDITADNGPLFYYPGSHRWPIYANEHIACCVSDLPQKPGQTVYEEMWRGLVEVNQAKPEVFLCKKGQALIWSANLLHGGSIQHDKNRTRWSQVTHYFFDDCAYYTPMWSDPFNGLVYFRKPVNVASGEVMSSHYLGHKLSSHFIEESRNGHSEFVAELYLAANPDVRAAGVDAATHYQKYGRAEGRPLRPKS